MDGKEKNIDRRAQSAQGTRNDRLKRSMHGRRRQARRKEALLIGSAVVLLFAVALACFIFLFRVQEINVTGVSQQRYTNAQIAEASGIRTGESMAFLKKDAAAARIERALPYIETAAVRRGFPNTVRISVTYARPALAVRAEAGYIVLSAKGKVLQVGAPAVSDYVAELRGVTVAEATPGENVKFTDEAAFGNVTSLTGAFAAAGYLNVTAYDVSDMQNITVEVDYKIDVKLGNASRVEKKLAFGKEVLVRTLEDARHSSSRLVVDLTTEGTAFVRSQRDIDEASKNALVPLPEEETGAGDAENGEAADEAYAADEEDENGEAANDAQAEDGEDTQD